MYKNNMRNRLVDRLERYNFKKYNPSWKKFNNFQSLNKKGVYGEAPKPTNYFSKKLTNLII